jgi:hypothetical protein
MAATKRFMNWTGVTFTPQNGSPTPITGVTSIQIDSGGSLMKFSGDGDRYSTTVINDFNDPTVTVHSADLAAVQAFPGAITYTLSNAVIASHPIHGAHRQFGQGTLTLTAISPDGITNPLSTSIAP